MLGARPANAQGPQPAEDGQPSLADMPLEDLLNIEVYSVSKREEPLFRAPSAIYVITAEDIRHSTATSIMELLRVVPGIEVGKIFSAGWAITARGFNNYFANKLLVLIDGRSVYTPLFSGVYWDVQDVMLEDIERIEVIRGPGGTLWGANAVNGVINIITKRAANTTGGLLSLTVGTEERFLGALRYGFAFGEHNHLRLYVKGFQRDSGKLRDPRFEDEWEQGRLGFRWDWGDPKDDSFTVQGDIYQGNGETALRQLHLSRNPLIIPQTLDDSPTEAGGGNLLGRWTRKISDDSNISLQLYYDRTQRNTSISGENRNTYDLEFRHQLRLGERHEIVWGFGYRHTHDDHERNFVVSYDPDSLGFNLYNFFIQDTMALVPDRLGLTLGAKLEYNDYTQWEFQPNVRLVYMPNDNHVVWGAVSRAVRTPSRAERDSIINLFVERIPGVPVPSLVTLTGNDDVVSETLVAYELGYRTKAIKNVDVDVTVFYHDYDDLATFEVQPTVVRLVPRPPHLFTNVLYDNRRSGEAYGAEVFVNWRVRPWWTLRGVYSRFKLDVKTRGNSTDTLGVVAEESSPNHRFVLESRMHLPKDLEFDVVLRYVDDLPALNTSSYTEMDVRLGWRPRDSLTLELIGQNLLDGSHMEFPTDVFGVPPSEVQRGVYGRVRWEF